MEVSNILKITHAFPFFRCPNGDYWALVDVAGRFSALRVGSNEFEDLVHDLYYASFQDAPSPAAFRCALGVIRAKTRASAKVCDVALRIGRDDGALYYDTRDERGRIIKVTSGGWGVIANPPCAFWQPPGMLGVDSPHTENGHDPDLVDAAFGVMFPGLSEKQRMLLVMWCVHSLIVGAPCPLLHLIGPPRSGIALLARIIKRAIDPCAGESLLKPKEAKDLILATRSMRIVLLGDFSSLPQALADAVYGILTGASIRPRKLYTDDDVTITSVQRAVILTSHDDIVRARGLREFRIRIDAIENLLAGPEMEVWRDFENYRRTILGGLFSAVSYGIGHLDSIRDSGLCYVNEFGLWTAAAAPAFGWDSEQWLRVYRENMGEQMVDALDASVIGRPLVEMVRARGRLSVTASQLLEMLRTLVRDRSLLPADHKALGTQLNKIASALRNAGIVFRRDNTKARDHKPFLVFDVDGAQEESHPTRPNAKPPSVDDCGNLVYDDSEE
ncbi:MAG: hypothetical protein HZB13_01765 [Acidobacteria bacterium]|nr:hypothetical protein [Acidobacteriota bacterium]